MVSVLAWTLLVLMVAVPLVLGLLSLRRERRPPAAPPVDRLTYVTLLKLHAVRQRLSVRQYRAQLQRDGDRARRALQAELAEWEKWEDGQ